MARFHSYYMLCPLIDQQSLLGVEKDKESGCVMLTLGRNIMIRYKLQDLKQISSWSSKERLTTQVIYDRYKQHYIAVFNEKKIRVWSEDETDLNNVKGYKFQSQLYAILPRDNASPVLVQQNGATASIEWAIENRKTWVSKGIIRTNEKLLNCQLIQLNGKLNLFCLTKIEEVHNCIVLRLEDDTCLEKADTVRRIELKFNSEDLAGYVIVHYKNNAFLLTLWSHGTLYSHFLTGTSTDSDLPDFTGLISMITNINTKYPVVMTHLSEAVIAVYGADVTDEGAVLMIYNVQFKLMQATKKLKLYTKDAKLWKVEDKLLLAANKHLAVASYNLAPQRISAIVGSLLKNENKEKNIEQWFKNHLHMKNSMIGKIPSSISEQIGIYLNEKMDETTIQETLILKLMESKDIASICWYLDMCKLPEKLIVALLAFALKSPDQMFVPMQNGTIDNVLKASHLHSRDVFLAKILDINKFNASLLSYLKTDLTFNEILKLLEYLIRKLSEETDLIDDNPQPSDYQLYEWSCMILDSHYQQYLLSQDSNVLKLFNQLNSILEEHLQFLEDLENLRPIFDRINNGKSSCPSSSRYNKFYSIEEIKLY